MYSYAPTPSPISKEASSANLEYFTNLRDKYLELANDADSMVKAIKTDMAVPKK